MHNYMKMFITEFPLKTYLGNTWTKRKLYCNPECLSTYAQQAELLYCHSLRNAEGMSHSTMTKGKSWENQPSTLFSRLPRLSLRMFLATEMQHSEERKSSYLANQRSDRHAGTIQTCDSLKLFAITNNKICSLKSFSDLFSWIFHYETEEQTMVMKNG